MIPRLRTIAILMLLAGLSLGIFASRALRAMGGGPPTDTVPGNRPYIEQQVSLAERMYGLDAGQTDRIRREFYRHDRAVQAKLWDLRQENAEYFQALQEETTKRIEAILEETREAR